MLCSTLAGSTPREYATIDRRHRVLWQCIHGVTTFDQRCHAGRAEQRIVQRRPIGQALRGRGIHVPAGAYRP
jgi:hypothetical protein